MYHLAHGAQRRVAFGGEGAVQAFTGQPGFFGNLCHTASRLNYVAQCGQKTGLATVFIQFLEGDAQVLDGKFGILTDHLDH